MKAGTRWSTRGRVTQELGPDEVGGEPGRSRDQMRVGGRPDKSRGQIGVEAPI